MAIGIACSSGSYKGVFVHGVLSAFTEGNLYADAYATASSSVVPGAFAAISQLEYLNGVSYWKQAFRSYKEHDSNISQAILDGIKVIYPLLSDMLFKAQIARFCVAVSAVLTKEAAEQTQGEGARRLGQQLILATRKRDTTWADSNLETRLFDTKAEKSELRLTPENLGQVFYATTRMLHAWKEPAWIDNRPYIDASYTCLCPAIQLVELGYSQVIAISPEPREFYVDLFQSKVLPESYRGTTILKIQPQCNLRDMGVDYLAVSDEGFERVYEIGIQAGKDFLRRCL